MKQNGSILFVSLLFTFRKMPLLVAHIRGTRSPCVVSWNSTPSKVLPLLTVHVLRVLEALYWGHLWHGFWEKRQVLSFPHIHLCSHYCALRVVIPTLRTLILWFSPTLISWLWYLLFNEWRLFVFLRVFRAITQHAGVLWRSYKQWSKTIINTLIDISLLRRVLSLTGTLLIHLSWLVTWCTSQSRLGWWVVCLVYCCCVGGFHHY